MSSNAEFLERVAKHAVKHKIKKFEPIKKFYDDKQSLFDGVYYLSGNNEQLKRREHMHNHTLLLWTNKFKK